MKGEVLIPFVATLEGLKIRATTGDIIELPPNVDWVAAGLVRVVEEEAQRKGAKTQSEAPKPKAPSKSKKS